MVEDERLMRLVAQANAGWLGEVPVPPRRLAPPPAVRRILDAVSRMPRPELLELLRRIDGDQLGA